MKLNSRFRNYLRLEALVVVLVMLSFRFIPDKKIASLIASTLFIVSTCGILYWEMRLPNFRKRPTFWGALVFLLVSVLPIFSLRLIFWDQPFDQIQIGGMTGAEIHKASNSVFILLLLCIFIDSYLEGVRNREKSTRP